jgi:hypothetical protein
MEPADDKVGIEYYLKKLAVLSGFLPIFGESPPGKQETEKSLAHMRANIPADKEVLLAEFDVLVVALFETVYDTTVRQSEGRYEYAIALTCLNYSGSYKLDNKTRIKPSLVEFVLDSTDKRMRVEWVRVADAPHYIKVKVQGSRIEILLAVKDLVLFGV